MTKMAEEAKSADIKEASALYAQNIGVSDSIHLSYAGAMKWASFVAQSLYDGGFTDAINTDYNYSVTDTLGNKIVCGVSKEKSDAFDRFNISGDDESINVTVMAHTEGIVYRKEECNFNTTTFSGRLTMFLKARYDAGLNGFLILPCELIDNNGDNLKECVLKYSADWNYGDDFICWVNEENVFMNTLVDRIVTGYPRDTAKEMEEKFGYLDNLIDTSEMFHLWVIEGDKKYGKELPFDKIGLNVIWTDDVAPYKKRKVRILNGAHTMLSASAMLMGMETVLQSMENEAISSFVRKGIFDEIIPTIDMNESELVKFANDVIERFRNPFIHHRLSDIVLNSVSKFKVRVLPSIRDYIDKFDKIPKCLVFSLAALIVFYKSGSPNDDKKVIDFMKRSLLTQILSNTDVWEDNLMYLKELVEKYILLIETDGIKSGLNDVLEKGIARS